MLRDSGLSLPACGSRCTVSSGAREVLHSRTHVDKLKQLDAGVDEGSSWEAGVVVAAGQHDLLAAALLGRHEGLELRASWQSQLAPWRQGLGSRCTFCSVALYALRELPGGIANRPPGGY